MRVSHNTFTYMRPLRWWMRLLQPIARCQSKPLEQQAKIIDCADMRVRFFGGVPCVCHGPVAYLPLSAALKMMAACGLHHCRLLVEGRMSDADIDGLKASLDDAAELWGITFYECRHKRTWRQLWDAPKIEGLEQYVGSMQSWYGKAWPWLWWRLHKAESRRKVAFGDCVAVDFV